jgi:hypothetical protein
MSKKMKKKLIIVIELKSQRMERFDIKKILKTKTWTNDSNMLRRLQFNKKKPKHELFKVFKEEREVKKNQKDRLRS